MAEVLRITRERRDLLSCLRNGIAEAVCDLENDLPSLAELAESAAHILLTLDAYAEQTAERKGCAR